MESATSNTSSRNAKRRKLRLMCADLTSDILNDNNEENNKNQYELADVNDSFRSEINGEMIEFNIKQMNILHKIDEGSFGIVYAAQLANKPDFIFACKKMTLRDNRNNSYSSGSDLKAMRTVGNDHHVHIVHFYGALLDLIDQQLVICMELLETSMNKFYRTFHSNFILENVSFDLVIRRLAKQVVLALNYLKSKNLIHRDIKPQNILVSRPVLFKLCDFGVCGILEDSLRSTHIGSMRYLPPERLGNNSPYGTRSDMWALGMSLFEISEGSLPFESEPVSLFLIQIKNGWEPQFSSKYSQQTKDLISILLRRNIDERPRYYTDILSMECMTAVKDHPSHEEVDLVSKVLDALPTKMDNS